MGLGISVAHISTCYTDIILDEICIVVPSISSMYFRVLCGVPLGKN